MSGQDANDSMANSGQYSDIQLTTDTSVQQQYRPGDLDHLFEELGEEWVEQDNDLTSSGMKSTTSNNFPIRTSSNESLGFDFATTRIEAQNIKKTPEWKRAINKRQLVQEPVKKSSLENLFNPPPEKHGSTNTEKLTAIMENDESASMDNSDISQESSEDAAVSRQSSPIKIFSNHDTTTKARLEGLLGSFDSVGSSAAHTINSERDGINNMSTVQEVSTVNNSQIDNGTDANRALTTQDYINDASDLMARLKQRGGPSTYSYAAAEESSYNTSDLSADTQSRASEHKLNERNSLMELQQRISYFEDSSGSDYASSSISEIHNLSIKDHDDASKATLTKGRGEIYDQSTMEQTSPQVKSPQVLPPTSKYHPNMKQITPQYFAEHKDRFGQNINMEFDSLKGVWKKRSISSTLYGSSNNEARKISQTVPLAPTVEIKNTPEIVQEQDVFDGIEDLDEKNNTISRSQITDPTDNGSMLVHNTSGLGDLSHSSMHTVVYESFQSSTSSGSVIIANRSRKISQYGVSISPASSPHISSGAEAPSVTNISIIQASFSQALGETIRILPFDSEGREKEVQYLNIPPNDKLTTTRWVGKSHPNLEILQAPEGKLRYIQGLPPSLRELNLAHNEVEDLGSQFHKLVNLEVVNLSSNGLSSSSFLKPLIHLRDLNLANNNIGSLDGISELPNLQKLVLDNNDIKGAIDFSRTKWTNLTIFSIKKNTKISSIIGLGHEHCKLKELYADGNSKLELISGEDKSQLLKLSINDCPQLSHLALAQFPKLQILKCDNNPGLTEFKDGYVPRTLKSVTLRRHGKDMNQHMFTQLCEVQRLSLRCTPINYLDFDNQFFLNLHVLDLANCGLKKLPENFNERCCNLRVLDLSGNEISDISPLEGIPKLVSLNLLDNQINRDWFKVLLRTIRTLEQLTELETRNNPVSRKMYGEEASMSKGILESRAKYRKAITDNSHGLNILDGQSFTTS